MLDRQDLEMIRVIMKEEITASEERTEKRIENRMDIRFGESEARMKKYMEECMDTRIAASENLILGELDRVQMSLQGQIDQLNRKIDELTEYYRIRKLDDVNDALLLQMIQDLEERVKALEKKSA